MPDPAPNLAAYDALSPEERAAVVRLLAESPDLARALRRWQGLRAEVGRQLAEALRDPELLVLLALSDEALPGEASGDGAAQPLEDSALSPDERARLDAALAELREALARHPGLADAALRIRADRDAFEAAWTAHLGGPLGEADEAVEASGMPMEEPSRREGRGAGLPHRPRRPGRRPAERDAAAYAARPPAEPVRRAGPARWGMRIGLLAAAVVFASVLVFTLQRDAGMDTVRAAEAQTLVLPDGSRAELARGAVVMVPREGRRGGVRQARLLAGDALFTIVPDPEQPFVVTTSTAEITVLGTVFSVRATDIQTDVTLVSGSVDLAPRAQPERAVRLTPGQASRVLAQDAPAPPAPADVGAALAWTGDVFARAEPAGTVATRLAARLGVRVDVDPALALEPVSGRFAGSGGAEASLDPLARALGARLEREGAGYRIAAP